LTHQEALLTQLLEDPELLFPETDKGLGPCAVTYDQYVEDCLVHLRNQECYQRLTKEEALAAVAALETDIEDWLLRYKGVIGRDAANFISKPMEDNVESPFGQFYVLYKIHKEKKNGKWPTRPVCSDVSSLQHGLGKWVNSMLVPVQQAQASYFKDSFALKEILDKLFLPPNALLFTSDAQSMYTNIKTEPAIAEISAYLCNHQHVFAQEKTEALIEALGLVFRNNYFKFGNTYWNQSTGTGMGTPSAPPWATVMYALHEDKMIPRWAENVPFYKRFIDDVIGVWLVHPDPEENLRRWLTFQADMNGWYGLSWDCTEPSTSINFMDLTISIVDSRLETTLYKKSQNLYLYIPPHSSHPKGVFTSLIFGQVLRIRRLCSHKRDADTKIKQFFDRLLARGHSSTMLLRLFQHAEANATSYMN
jgi:hypothetical protein